MKKILTAFATVAMSASMLFCGCVNVSGVDGRNGKDGQDVSIYEIYEATNSEREKAGLSSLTFLEFIDEYLNFDNSAVDDAASLKASINRSLLSCVSIASGFKVRTMSSHYPWTVTEETCWSFGSGVIVDIDKENGNAYVVTNCHVIYSDSAVDSKISQNVYLFLYGQDTEYNVADCSIPATVVGASRTYDIALLKVEASTVLQDSEAVSAEFSQSDDVYIGETVYAIGNPESYGLSATQGIISKESETIEVTLSESYYNKVTKEYRVLRTDAAINGGNSGGGLFGTDGKLVGIVNAKASSDDIDNMGYALPSSNVRRLLKLMKDEAENFDGSVTGVRIPKIEAEYSYKECPSKFNSAENRVEVYENVYITADCGDLKADDSIRHIKICDTDGNTVEDREVTRVYHVTDTLLSAREGYKVTLTVSRNGNTVEVDVPVIMEATD